MKKIIGALLILLLAVQTAAWAEGLLLPEGLRAIGEEAFQGDASIVSAAVPEGVEEIGPRAFADSGLRQISLPASLQQIAEDAFAGCADLRVTAPMGSYAYLWAAQRDLLAPEAYPDSAQVTVPATLQAGENLTVSLIGPQNAVWHNVFLLGPDTRLIATQRSKAGEVSWRGYELEPGEYRVVVYTVTEDYGSLLPITREVTITGEKEAGPTLELPESMPQYTEISIPLDTAYLFHAARYDQTGSLLYDWEYEEAYSLYLESWGADGEEGGYWEYSAAEYRDGRWTEFGPVSRVEITPLPALDAPEINLPDIVAAGRDLTFSYGSVENARQYNLNVFLIDDAAQSTRVFSVNSTTGKTVTLPGYNLRAGQYRLTLTVYPDNDSLREIRVEKEFSAEGPQPAAPEVTVERGEIYVNNDRVPARLHAEGAEGIMAIYLFPSNDAASIEGPLSFLVSVDENGDADINLDYPWGDREDFIGLYAGYRFAAIAGDTWSPWSEPVKLLIQRRDPLPQSVITAPESIQAGQDFAFSFAPVEQATSYSVSVERAYGGNTIYSWYSNTLGTNVIRPDAVATLPGHYLAAGSYRLTVTASSEQYGSSESEWLFTVTGSRPAAPAVTPGQETARINDTLSFTIGTEGAEAAQIKVGRHNSSISYGDSLYSPAVSGTETEWSWRADDYLLGFTADFSFSVKKDGRWSAWKNLSYVIQDRPALAAPVIHAEDSYTAGEDFSIRFDAVENAESYQYILWNAEGNSSQEIKSNNSPFEMSYFGYQFLPGSYRLTVTAQAAAYKSGAAERVITILPNQTPAMDVSADRAEIDEGESVTFTLDTTGAEEVRYTTGDFFRASAITVLSDTTTWITTPGAGVRSYRFSALIDGHWTAWSSPITVTVHAAEPMPAPTIILPETLSLGQDLTVIVEDIPGATEYWVYLLNGRGAEITSYYHNGSSGDTFTFNGYLLSAGVVKVRVYAYGRGSAETTNSLRVLAGSRPAAPEAQAEHSAITVNSQARFTLSAEGAEQAVARYYRAGYPNEVSYQNIAVAGDSTNWNRYLYSAGNYIFAFSAQQDGVWSPWSAGIEIAVE